MHHVRRPCLRVPDALLQTLMTRTPACLEASYSPEGIRSVRDAEAGRPCLKQGAFMIAFMVVDCELVVGT